MIRVAAFAFLLLFLVIHRMGLLFSLSLSVSQHHKLFVSKFFSTLTQSSNLVLFFLVNVIVIAILVGSLKPSTRDFDSFSYVPPPLACGVVDYKHEKTKDEDCNYDKDDFLPRLVHVEYCKKEEVLLLEYVDDDSEGFHGYDGYEEDNDDEGGDDDDVSSEEGEKDEDLRRRIEDFIAKNNKKWQEELLHDKLLWLVPT
ncbi:hypothetical protein CEY00_Acc10638 [Actinidia chinensis var. chinensis]|uniref:Uncharacterized protein n=1 Tax=Actinidia chinensis var. chinensis TaxID=1590841 RepID=A0A2R6R6E7_ACTCC|nr:hypothetical protein CEY00_Acc10638 [Actinidia chinensis var. chinensis]